MMARWYNADGSFNWNEIDRQEDDPVYFWVLAHPDVVLAGNILLTGAGLVICLIGVPESGGATLVPAVFMVDQLTTTIVGSKTGTPTKPLIMQGFEKLATNSGYSEDDGDGWYILAFVASDLAAGAAPKAMTVGRSAMEEMRLTPPRFEPLAAPNRTLVPLEYQVQEQRLAGTGLQANHSNQNALTRSIIPKEEGTSVGLRGNAFLDKGTPHYNFHSSTEGFWDQYRAGGQFAGDAPTFNEYVGAIKNAYIKAGYSESESAYLANDAAIQLRDAIRKIGLNMTDKIPMAIPNKMGQVR
jgi:hypothetical protein